MIKWEEPAKDTRGRKPGSGKWVQILEALKERPGEWALVAENAWVQNARQVLIPNGCEVTCREMSKETAGKAGKIYARYLGEES